MARRAARRLSRDPRPVNAGSASDVVSQPQREGYASAASLATTSLPLRRMDWRFMLPGSCSGRIRKLVLLGGPAGLGERILETGFAETVVGALPRNPTADAVVVLEGPQPRAADIMKALLPGGVVYWEVSRRRGGLWRSSPGRLRRELRAAGATIEGVFAALPNLRNPRALVPMEEPGALAWFVRTLFPPSSPARWPLEKAALLLGGGFRLPIARLAPAFVITASRDAAPSSPAVLAKATLPGIDDATRLRPLMLVDDGNRLVMLPFAPGGRQPIAVLKIPKLPAFNDRTINESEMLSRLRPLLDARLRNDVPEPLARFSHDTLVVAVEGYLGGESLDRSTGRWGGPMHRKVDDLSRAAQWLSRFHRQVLIAREPWRHGQIRELVDDPLRSYEHAFGLTPDEQRLAARARAYAREMSSDVELPITWIHRDFNVWNVFRFDDRIRVIDWEGCRPGPALCDLLHFSAPWFQISQRLRTQEERLLGFERMLFGPAGRNRASLGARVAIRRYMEDLQLDLRLLPVLLTYTWLELALRRADQQALQGGRAADARAGNHFVPHVAVLARHADLLFATDDRGFAASYLGRP